MNKEKALAEMSPRDVTNMENILMKDKNSVLPAELELLNARRMYLTDDELVKYGINAEVKGGDYSSMKFADLKKEAKERGIELSNSTKQVEIIALLEQYDNLQDGDEFQGKIAQRATQEMIDENDLADQLEVGDLFFVDKEAIKEEEEK